MEICGNSGYLATQTHGLAASACTLLSSTVKDAVKRDSL